MSQSNGGAQVVAATDSSKPQQPASAPTPAQQSIAQANAFRPKNTPARQVDSSGNVSIVEGGQTADQLTAETQQQQAKDLGFYPGGTGVPVGPGPGGSVNSVSQAIGQAQKQFGITYESQTPNLVNGILTSGGASPRDIYVGTILGEAESGFKGQAKSTSEFIANRLGQVGLSIDSSGKITDPLEAGIVSEQAINATHTGLPGGGFGDSISSPVGDVSKAYGGLANFQPETGLNTKGLTKPQAQSVENALSNSEVSSSDNAPLIYSNEQVASLISAKVNNKEYSGDQNFLVGNLNTENSTGSLAGLNTEQARNTDQKNPTVPSQPLQVSKSDISSLSNQDLVNVGGTKVPATLLFVQSQEAVDKANAVRESLNMSIEQENALGQGLFSLSKLQNEEKRQLNLQTKQNQAVDNAINLLTYDQSLNDLISEAKQTGAKSIEIFENVPNDKTVFPTHNPKNEGTPLSVGEILESQTTPKLITAIPINENTKDVLNKTLSKNSGKDIGLILNTSEKPVDLSTQNNIASSKVDMTSGFNPQIAYFQSLQQSSNPVISALGVAGLRGIGGVLAANNIVYPLVGAVESAYLLPSRYANVISDVLSGNYGKSVKYPGTVFSPEAQNFMDKTLPKTSGGIAGILTGQGVLGISVNPDVAVGYAAVDIGSIIVGSESLLGKALPIKLGQGAIVNFPTAAKIPGTASEVVTSSKILLGYGGKRSVGLLGKTEVVTTSTEGETAGQIVSKETLNNFLASKLKPNVNLETNTESTFGLHLLEPSQFTERGFRLTELNKLTQSKLLSSESTNALDSLLSASGKPVYSLEESSQLLTALKARKGLLNIANGYKPNISQQENLAGYTSSNLAGTPTEGEIVTPIPVITEEAKPSFGQYFMSYVDKLIHPSSVTTSTQNKSLISSLTSETTGTIPNPSTPEDLEAYNQIFGVNTMKTGEVNISQINYNIGQFMERLNNPKFYAEELAKAKASKDTQLIEDLGILKKEPKIQKGSGINERIIANYNKSNEEIPTVGYPWKDIDIPIESEKAPAALARLANKYVEVPEGLGFGVKKGTTNIFFGELGATEEGVPRLAQKGKEVFNLLTEEDISKQISGYNTPGKFFGKDLPHNVIKIGKDKTFSLASQSTGLMHSLLSGQTTEHLAKDLEGKSEKFKAGLMERLSKSNMITTGINGRVEKDVNRAYQVLELGKRETFDYVLGRFKFGGKQAKALGELQESLLTSHHYVDIEPHYSNEEVTSALLQLREAGAKERALSIGNHNSLLTTTGGSISKDLVVLHGNNKEPSITQNKSKIESSAKSPIIKESTKYDMLSSSVKGSTESESKLSALSPKSAASVKSGLSSKSPKSTKSPRSPSSPRSTYSPSSPKSPLSSSPKSPLSPKSPSSPKSPTIPASKLSALSGSSSSSSESNIEVINHPSKKYPVALDINTKPDQRVLRTSKERYNYIGNSTEGTLVGLYNRNETIYGNTKINKLKSKDYARTTKGFPKLVNTKTIGLITTKKTSIGRKETKKHGVPKF